jgi:hypothetical protein
MKRLPVLCASIVLLSGVALCDGSAFGAVNYNSSKSNTGNVTVQPKNKCSKGQVWDAAAKKCIAMSSINYNASKSNTGNVTATPLNNRQNVNGTNPPK